MPPVVFVGGILGHLNVRVGACDLTHLGHGLPYQFPLGTDDQRAAEDSGGERAEDHRLASAREQTVQHGLHPAALGVQVLFHNVLLVITQVVHVSRPCKKNPGAESEGSPPPGSAALPQGLGVGGSG